MTTNNENSQVQTPPTLDPKIVEHIKASYNPRALEIAFSQFIASESAAGKSEEDLKPTFDFHINELALKGLILIPIEQIKREHLKEMGALISFLQTFFLETKKKQETIIGMDNAIFAKIQDLFDKGIIKINQEELEKSRSVIRGYCEALDGVCQDISSHVERFTMFQTMPLPSVTSVLFFEPHNFEEYLHAKIREVKKGMKKLQSEVNIGYSQYFVKLDEHEKQLAYLEKSTKATK